MGNQEPVSKQHDYDESVEEVGEDKKHDHDEDKGEADNVNLKILVNLVSSVDYTSNKKEGLGEEYQSENKRKKRFSLDNAVKLPKLETESMRSTNSKELDETINVTTNELFANQTKIIRLKLSTKNQLFDYVDRISIGKTNVRDSKKFHKIKRLHKTSRESEHKPNVIQILREILAPKDVTQSPTNCPQCYKHFCNQSYLMLHVMKRHNDIAE